MMEYEEILLRKMDTFVYSYLVSAEICKKMKNSLMNEIVLKGTRTKQYNEYLTQIKQCPTIAVSIRCADDYVLNNWPVCSKEFYINGIKKVIEKKENCQIFVFADDLSKVKEENWFKDIDAVIVYIDRLSVCESFELMRNCNYYVCSNSSFSWWGAFLTYSEDTLIFSSNRIFGSEQKYDALTKYDEVIYLDYITGELST